MKISVKAHPRSRQAKIVKTGESSFEVWIHEAPDKGRANEAIVEMLGEHLGIARSRISLVSGTTAKNKIFSIDEP